MRRKKASASPTRKRSGKAKPIREIASQLGRESGIARMHREAAEKASVIGQAVRCPVCDRQVAADAEGLPTNHVRSNDRGTCNGRVVAIVNRDARRSERVSNRQAALAIVDGMERQLNAQATLVAGDQRSGTCGRCGAFSMRIRRVGHTNLCVDCSDQASVIEQTERVAEMAANEERLTVAWEQLDGARKRLGMAMVDASLSPMPETRARLSLECDRMEVALSQYKSLIVDELRERAERGTCDGCGEQLDEVPKIIYGQRYCPSCAVEAKRAKVERLGLAPKKRGGKR